MAMVESVRAAFAWLARHGDGHASRVTTARSTRSTPHHLLRRDMV
jgi:hypothetical protein